MDSVLKQAIKACEDNFGIELWLCMDPSEQTEAIYREMRRIDLEMTPGRVDCQAPSVGTPEWERSTTLAANVGRRRGLMQNGRAVRCCATIKTRASDQCSWRATVFRDGRPYCGLHDPVRTDRSTIDGEPQIAHGALEERNTLME